jgi:hypothetical protein
MQLFVQEAHSVSVLSWTLILGATLAFDAVASRLICFPIRSHLIKYFRLREVFICVYGLDGVILRLFKRSLRFLNHKESLVIAQVVIA